MNSDNPINAITFEDAMKVIATIMDLREGSYIPGERTRRGFTAGYHTKTLEDCLNEGLQIHNVDPRWGQLLASAIIYDWNVMNELIQEAKTIENGANQANDW